MCHSPIDGGNIALVSHYYEILWTVAPRQKLAGGSHHNMVHNNYGLHIHQEETNRLGLKWVLCHSSLFPQSAVL